MNGNPDYEMSKYAIALQRAIEAHCKGRMADETDMGGCPWHAKMLNRYLTRSADETMMDEANEEYEERTAERHEALLRDAARYRWLRNGGWEVLQNPKYWTPENKFDGAVDAAMLDVALNAAQERANRR